MFMTYVYNILSNNIVPIQINYIHFGLSLIYPSTAHKKKKINKAWIANEQLRNVVSTRLSLFQYRHTSHNFFIYCIFDIRSQKSLSESIATIDYILSNCKCCQYNVVIILDYC